MSDLPILDELRDDLLAAMRAAETPAKRPRVRSLRPVLVAALLALALAATAAAATYYVLRASPIAPFKPTDTTPEQRVAPGTSRVLDLRAADPAAGVAPWALRLARSQTGLLCGTVGQVDGDQFGIVGLDRRFRALPEPNADACGQPDADGLALLGTRVFDADREKDVRTVVYGAAGPELERVTIAVRGGRAESLEPGPEGAFVRAYAGFPEDLQPVVSLRYADGQTRRLAIARGKFVVPDPLGGNAWQISAFAEGQAPGDNRPKPSCTQFASARYREGTHARSPGLCGFGDVYYGARRLHGRRRLTRDIYEGAWNRHDPRTALWGGTAAGAVRDLVVTGPNGLRRTLRPMPNGAFLLVLDPKVDPASLAVEVHFRDGRILRTGPDHGLVDPEDVG
jgi:hypothetical protein